jgi:CcmD family protein
MTPIQYVGLAYAMVFLLFFGYALRLTRNSKELEKKLDQLERETRGN